MKIEEQKLNRIVNDITLLDNKIRNVNEKLGYSGKNERINTAFGKRMGQLGKVMRDIKKDDAVELHRFIHSRDGEEFMQWLKATIADKVLYENLMKLELQFKGTGIEDAMLLKGTINDFRENVGDRLEKSAESMRNGSLSAQDADSMRKEIELDHVKRVELERLKESLKELSIDKHKIILDAYNKSNEFLKQRQKVIESMKMQREIHFDNEKSIEAMKSLISSPSLNSEALKAARDSLMENNGKLDKAIQNKIKNLSVADHLLNAIKNRILGYKGA